MQKKNEDIKIFETREFIKIVERSKMLDRVMNYLDKNYPDIYNTICRKEISIMKEEIKELKEKTRSKNGSK